MSILVANISYALMELPMTAATSALSAMMTTNSMPQGKHLSPADRGVALRRRRHNYLTPKLAREDQGLMLHEVYQLIRPHCSAGGTLEWHAGGLAGRHTQSKIPHVTGTTG